MHQICCIVAAGKRALQYGEPIQYTPAQYENAITFSCLPGKLFSAKIFHRTISSNGMIRYYCPSPKIRKPQSAFPIRFFIGRKTFRSLECPPKFKARQDTERPNPKKALLKHPSIEIRPFYRPTVEKLSKRLKTSKKGEIGPNFSCSKISRGSACDTKLFYSLHRRPDHQSLSRTVTQKFRRSRHRRSALIRMRSSVNQ